jgi:aminopeptidase YwaD
MTAPKRVEQRIREHLEELVRAIGERPPGSPANRRATDYAARVLREAGWEVTTPAFTMDHWESGGAEATVDGGEIPLHVGPWSPGFSGRAPLVAAGSRADLEAVDAEGKILLLHDELVREQLMPKGFPFYNPDHHRERVALIEAKRPAAVLAATGRNPELAGSLYPFPLIEDGDFSIPNAYLRDSEAGSLLRHTGHEVTLNIRSTRAPSTGHNVIASNAAPDERRSLLVAHIDTKHDTPGALDNAAGVVSLLAFAESFRDPASAPPVEIVLFNGEDNWAVPGQLEYLRGFEAERVRAVINIDAAGYIEGPSALSSYNLDEEARGRLERLVEELEGVVLGPPWMQSDHAMFAQMGLPALAITSERTTTVFSEITHTAADDLDVVDTARLAQLVPALTRLLTDAW